MERADIGIGELIALLINAATLLKNDGVDLFFDPSRDTEIAPQEITLAYAVSTALGEHFGDGKGEYAYGGQSLLDPPKGRKGYKGKEDSHGPWQHNMLTWVKDKSKTDETLLNAPMFIGMTKDEIREEITTNNEAAAYAYLWTINVPRFQKKIEKVTSEMEDKEVLKILDNAYKDWSSSKGSRSKAYLNRDESDYAPDRGIPAPEGPPEIIGEPDSPKIDNPVLDLELPKENNLRRQQKDYFEKRDNMTPGGREPFPGTQINNELNEVLIPFYVAMSNAKKEAIEEKRRKAEESGVEIT